MIAYFVAHATDAHVVLPEPDDALVGAFGELIDDYPRRTRRLRLSLLEAFYLLHQERRLQLHTGPGGTAAPMDETESWAAFSAAVPRFAHTYATYRHLRSAGWRLRNGLNFGVDFTLYDPATPTAHARAGALIIRAPGGDGPPENWLWLQRHSRVCGSVAKSLLLCSVEEEGDGALDLGSLDCLRQLRVRTLRFAPFSAAKENSSFSAAPRPAKGAADGDDAGGGGAGKNKKRSRDAPQKDPDPCEEVDDVTDGS